MHDEIRKECPNCPKRETPSGKVVGVELDLIYDNYSGCGVDICGCPKCDKQFQVNYTIESIVEIN
jgi:hypothetical protein